MHCEKLDKKVRELEGLITDEELFHLLMVALDRKPGGLVMDPDFETVERLEQSLDDLDIDCKTMGGSEMGLIDRLLGRRGRFDTKGFFFTRESSRFKRLEDSEGKFYGCSNEAVGEFLGYPVRSVSYYSKSGNIGMDTVKEIQERFDDLELRYLALVGYIPSPEKDQVEKAVEKGREKSRVLDELEDKGLSIGTELRDRLIAESHWS